MNISFKNKWLIGLMVPVFAVHIDVSAEPKTWTKDASGRVLVYRAPKTPSYFLFMYAAYSTLGILFLHDGLKGQDRQGNHIDTIGRIAFGLMGGISGGFGLWQFKRLYHNYDLLYKPLIIIDKRGISIEGKGKIFWKKIISYESCFWNDYPADWEYCFHLLEDYLKIVTDTNEYYKIHEFDLAITLKELKKLIDEAYSEYKKSEQEKR